MYRLFLVKCIFYYKIFNIVVHVHFYYSMFCMLKQRILIEEVNFICRAIPTLPNKLAINQQRANRETSGEKFVVRASSVSTAAFASSEMFVPGDNRWCQRQPGRYYVSRVPWLDYRQRRTLGRGQQAIHGTVWQSLVITCDTTTLWQVATLN